MKANELRIGNLLNNDGVVVTIDARSIFDIWNDEGLKNYKPIPLTEEWLIRFGFQPMTCISFNWETEYIISPKKLPLSIGVLLGDYQEDNPNCGVVSMLQPNDEVVGSIPDDLYNKEEWTDEDRERALDYKVTVPKWRQPIAYHFKYVHQLQNVYFALTGSELKLS